MKILIPAPILILFVILQTYSTVYAQKQEKILYYVDNESSFNSFSANIDKITIIAPQSFKMDAKGNIAGSVDSRVLDLAKLHNISVMPLIVNPNFDEKIIHTVLNDSVARRKAVTTMLKLCKDNGFLGIQFDFEHIHVDDRDAFTRFVREAANALHAEGFLLSVAVIPRTADAAEPGAYQQWYFNNLSGAYDYKALAEVGDFLSIMTYNEHSRRTPPGPVAGISWMEKVIQYLLTQVPPRKISFGIPFYSYHWFADANEDGGFSDGTGIDFQQAMAILSKNKASLIWNDENKVSYAFFLRQNVFEYLFVENARSFKAKLDLIKKYKLRGFSSWRLGLEDPKVWNFIK